MYKKKEMFARATRRIQMRTPVSIAVHPHPHSFSLGNVDFPGDKRALKEDDVQCRHLLSYKTDSVRAHGRAHTCGK